MLFVMIIDISKILHLMNESMYYIDGSVYGPWGSRAHPDHPAGSTSCREEIKLTHTYTLCTCVPGPFMGDDDDVIRH